MGEGEEEERILISAVYRVFQVSLASRSPHRLDPSYVSYLELIHWLSAHCSVYIALMVYCYHTRQKPIFLIAAIMELPTFDLAISNLLPRVRNDLRFLSSFFAIRICFHAAFLIDCVRPSSRAVTDGSWVPTAALTLAFVLHASWFYGGIMGFIKRRSKLKSTSSSALAPASRTASTDEQLQVLGEIHQSAERLIVEDGLSTPDDSPLITPRTPKSYAVLSNLPSMPHLPNLGAMPTVSIPSFSDLTAALAPRDQFATGFKDAVKHRWEEQKDRFAGIRGGVGMNFDRLGIRRRGREDHQEN